jgi:translation initiation factor 1 (eIF-1/SUI1)
MPPRPPNTKLPACGFFVTVNENDESVPLKVKKVAKGKKVSILSGITGSRPAAVSTLKQLLGVGGEVSPDVPNAIELQGDQSGRIATILRNLGALRGEKVANGPVLVLQPKQGYEKFMKQKDEAVSSTLQTDEMSKACILVHGRYWPYCNGNCQFCPPLTDVFEGLDMYCSWYDPESVNKPVKSESSEPVPEMTKDELDVAFGSLGMRAQVGEALRSYEKEKKMRPWQRTEGASVPQEELPIAKRFDPIPVRVGKPKPAFVDRPVRVIMNRPMPEEETSDWFVMELSLRDYSQWISDYESFIMSLLSETFIEIAHHELIDSKTLKLLFFEKQSMENCESILNDVLPQLFEIKKRDALNPIVMPPEAPIDIEDEISEESVPSSIDFELLAIEYGVDSNEEFWKHFTQLVEDSDGTNEGLLRAFQGAILHATAEDPEA